MCQIPLCGPVGGRESVIKGRLTQSDGKPALLIGLSRENCARLLLGLPIHIKAAELAELGLPDGMDVMVVAGETEGSIAKSLDAMPLTPEVAGQRFVLKGTLS